MSIEEIMHVIVFLLSFIVCYFLLKKYISKRAKSEGLSSDDYFNKEFDSATVRLMEHISKDWDKED